MAEISATMKTYLEENIASAKQTLLDRAKTDADVFKFIEGVLVLAAGEPLVEQAAVEPVKPRRKRRHRPTPPIEAMLRKYGPLTPAQLVEKGKLEKIVGQPDDQQEAEAWWLFGARRRGSGRVREWPNGALGLPSQRGSLAPVPDVPKSA